VVPGGVRSVLGDLPVAPKGTAGEAATVIIRPENVRADGTGAVSLGEARITEAIFQGAHYRVQARSETTDQMFILRLPPRAAPEAGGLLNLSCAEADLVAV